MKQSMLITAVFPSAATEPRRQGLYAGTLENSVTPTRPSTGKLLDALGKAAEPFIHVLQRLRFCALRT